MPQRRRLVRHLFITKTDVMSQFMDDRVANLLSDLFGGLAQP